MNSVKPLHSTIDHAQLVKCGEKWLKGKGCGVTFRDEFKAITMNGERPDVIGWRDGLSIMLECKSSRADFLADKKKSFRINPALGMGDWRFYLCPKNVIKVQDLPEGWGLLYAEPSKAGIRIFQIHGVPSNCNWWTQKPFAGNRQCENEMMYSALRRMVLRGHFDSVYSELNSYLLEASGSGS